MRYANRTIIVSRSRIAEAEGRVARQRNTVRQLENTGDPAVNAVALLLVMEQSPLSMKRFLATLERDLELSLGQGKTQRRKAAHKRSGTSADQIAQQVVDALRRGGIEAEQVPVSTAPGAATMSEPGLGRQDEAELPVGEQDQESAAQIADGFATLAVKIVLKENSDLPVLSVIAKVRPQPR